MPDVVTSHAAVALDPQRFDACRLERVFARCFRASHATLLLGGAGEPLYRPAAGAGDVSRLYYRADYFASALHEAAHWCIAGEARRRLVDFGYWYVGDGRSTAQQRRFEAVEYKPQALEWIFSRACGWRFRVSLDNLDGECDFRGAGTFHRRILRQVSAWCEDGLPPRAGRFYAALCAEFGTTVPVPALAFSLAELA